MKQINNPQDWLPIGQRVIAPSDQRFYKPKVFSALGEGPFFADRGKVVEHLSGGAIAVKFDNYPNTVDYSAVEANQFQRAY